MNQEHDSEESELCLFFRSFILSNTEITLAIMFFSGSMVVESHIVDKDEVLDVVAVAAVVVLFCCAGDVVLVAGKGVRIVL